MATKKPSVAAKTARKTIAAQKSKAVLAKKKAVDKNPPLKKSTGAGRPKPGTPVSPVTPRKTNLPSLAEAIAKEKARKKAVEEAKKQANNKPNKPLNEPKIVPNQPRRPKTPQENDKQYPRVTEPKKKPNRPIPNLPGPTSPYNPHAKDEENTYTKKTMSGKPNGKGRAGGFFHK